MITIGLTVCDNDYENCQKVLDQIKHKVKVKHEVVIIDNREKFKDVKTKWKPTYSFGYDAYQFAARTKIIEYAKGDYLWFVDGDDEILELNEFNYTEDIIAYSFYSCSQLNDLGDSIIDQNIFTNETLIKVFSPLWNKIIKKSLFDNLDLEDFRKNKVVTLEDTTFTILALRNAKTLRTTKQILYNHFIGMSGIDVVTDINVLKTLSTGFEYISRRLKKEMASSMPFYNNLIQSQCRYMTSFIRKSMSFVDSNKCDLVCENIRLNMELFPKNIFLPIFAETCAEQICKLGYQKEVFKLLVDFYKDPNLSIQHSFVAPYYDERNKRMSERTFTQTIPVASLFFFSPPQKWEHKLSVIVIIRDNDDLEQLLNKFSRIKTNKELVVIDLRSNNDFIPHGDDIKIVTDLDNSTDYRLKGIENSSGDYIWFINPEDDIAEILDINYGDDDIISFPYVNSMNLNVRQTAGEMDRNDAEWSNGCIKQFDKPLWNKWFKKEVLEQAYKDLKNTNHTSTERSLIFYSALKYSNKICVFDSVSSIYWHKKEDYLTVSDNLKTKTDVNVFFEYVNSDVDTISAFDFIDKEAIESFKYETVMYCLNVMINLDKSLLKFFSNTLKNKYGADYVSTVFKGSYLGHTDIGNPIKKLIG